MRIVKVKYSKLVSGDNYNNEMHGAEAVVDDGESPVAVHKELVEWVDAKVSEGIIGSGLERSSMELRNEICEMGFKKERLSGEINSLINKIAKMKDFLSAHGVDITDEIPF